MPQRFSWAIDTLTPRHASIKAVAIVNLGVTLKTISYLNKVVRLQAFGSISSPMHSQLSGSVCVWVNRAPGSGVVSLRFRSHEKRGEAKHSLCSFPASFVSVLPCY